MGENFTAGSIVHARGREWVVLPSQVTDLLRLRPLTGTDGQEIGVYLPLEKVQPAEFGEPEPTRIGDATGIMTLFDAARLSLRSGAAPFRSLGRISVVPRPYQFVPLIMSLRLDPVRLMIADDVGVGKTIEAGLVLRELIDRGVVGRFAVLCPPHLCEHWEERLREMFGLEAAVVQPSRMARLERALPRGDMSIYAYYPYLVGSIDFLKSDRHRDRFIANAPEMIIVDEAHIAARPRGGVDRAEQQRYELLRALADDPKRHLVLVTATPHNGIEESFRSLLGLLDTSFEGDAGQRVDHKRLAPHLVQRRRRDVESWLETETPFPQRESEEVHYALSRDYAALFDDVLEYCRESISAGAGLRAAQQRVRHWAAIAILRCLLSSPAAAASVLANRSARLGEEAGDAPSIEEIDDAYRPQVLDALADQEAGDFAPAGPIEDAKAAWSMTELRRLSDFRRRAQALAGPESDRKLAGLADILRRLLSDGSRPIVFCRFIPTANYLADLLPPLLEKEFPGLHVQAVTSEIGDEQRREKIDALAQDEPRILVATDCLSEGIDLQDGFDAVVHYDLPWNPNRLEQREGRVDRYGQKRATVRTVLLYGSNSQVDQVVLEVLIRKARKIRRDLGIAVPVPTDSEQVMQTIVDNVLLRRASREIQLELAFSTPEVSQLHAAWDKAAADLRTRYAQEAIDPRLVAREIEATDSVLGDTGAVMRFLADALQRFGGQLDADRHDGVFHLAPGTLQADLSTVVDGSFPMRVTFDRRKDDSALYLGRTHPMVAQVCDSVIGRAFAEDGDELFTRSGAMYTRDVAQRTALLLLRLRYMLKERSEQFAEEIVLTGFRRGAAGPAWLDPLETAGRDLADRAQPSANMSEAEKAEHAAWALGLLKDTPDWFRPIIDRRRAALQDSHDRLRSMIESAALEIRPYEPPDVIGCFVLVPAGGAG